DAAAPTRSSRRRRALQRVRTRRGARPRPLEVVATEPPGDVDRLADEVQPGDAAAFHRLRAELARVDAAHRDLGLAKAFAAIGGHAPALQLLRQRGEVAVADVGQ